MEGRPLCRLLDVGRWTLDVRPMEHPAAAETEQILGIHFFRGTAAEAVAQISRSGGLVVAPSGTCFERFVEDAEYRRAILSADLVLPDSGAMVVLWRILRGRKLPRISGLAYLKQLLGEVTAEGGGTFWILPHERAREKLRAWGKTSGLTIDLDLCYIAPIYENTVVDQAAAELIARRQPRHIIIAIGAGAQEKLGCYLRAEMAERPAIHCIGGALGFVTGDQVAIPAWADRFYLGWFLRLLSQPRAFLPRLWKARVLPGLLLREAQKRKAEILKS